MRGVFWGVYLVAQFACDSDIQPLPLLMSHNKRRRTGEKDAIPKVSALISPQELRAFNKLRLSNELAWRRLQA
jgi:hypothetical protein